MDVGSVVVRKYMARVKVADGHLPFRGQSLLSSSATSRVPVLQHDWNQQQASQSIPMHRREDAKEVCVALWCILAKKVSGPGSCQFLVVHIL